MIEPVDDILIINSKLLNPVETKHLLLNGALVMISFNRLIVHRSQMIGDDDYHFITDFINSDATRRGTLLADQRTQCAKTFLSLLEHISKDQTVQYILTIMDDLLQVLLLLGFTICHSLTD